MWMGVSEMRDARHKGHLIQARSREALTEAGDFKTWVPRVYVRLEEGGEHPIKYLYYGGTRTFRTQEDADKYALTIAVKWIDDEKPHLPGGDWEQAETEDDDG